MTRKVTQPKPPSRILEAVHQTAADLHKLGLIDSRRMQEGFWGRIPISMRSTRKGHPKGGGFWRNPKSRTLTPITRGPK